MNSKHVLGVLSSLMSWSADQSTKEFSWLILMAGMKYDDYQDFLAGARFVENLVVWLQQFKPLERECAYAFIKKHLVFISMPEIRHLVELFYPFTVQPAVSAEVAVALGRPQYLTWSDAKGVAEFTKRLRKVLFVELSDGARIDLFRRANSGTISNEQVVTAPSISDEKWDDMLMALRNDLGSQTEKFSRVYLIDDFTGSGTTLIRKEIASGQWKGKLRKFWDELESHGILNTHLEQGWQLNVHHYLATQDAVNTIAQRSAAMHIDLPGKWPKDVVFTYGTELPPEMKLTKEDLGSFAGLVDAYYDPAIESKHIKIGGTNAKMGFGGCALPLILEHNTPNNSVALLWAETSGQTKQHAMRPLFRRRQRHV